MSFVVLPNGKNYFATSLGTPAAGYKVYAYVAGTTTPKDTYTDSTGATPNAHPVVLDSRGEAAIYWTGTYDVVLKDAAGATIWGPERIVEPASSAALTTFEADLASTSDAAKGDALVGVKRTATGAVGSTLHAQYEATGLNVRSDFGAVADDTTDALAAFQACYSACVSAGLPMLIPGGTYKLTGSWTISHSNVRVIPLGLVTLHFTNAGRGLIIDGGAVSGNVYNAIIGGDIPIRVKGNATTTDGVFVRSVHHSVINIDVKDCVTACRVNFAVCTTFRIECSVNTGAFVLTPTTGMILDQRGAGEYVAACEIYPIIEGVSGNGINGVSASFTNIIGGTLEGNATGLTWGANCYLNGVHNTDFEANTVDDIEDAGNNNSYYNVRSGSAAANVVLSGNGASFYGGYLRKSATTGSTLTSYTGVAFSDNGALGITGTGTIASRVGCTRVNTSAVVTAKYSDIVGEPGGTWTPTFASAGGGAQGATTTAVGTYSSVGKLCFVQGNMTIAKGTLAAGAVSVTGLPFASRSTTNDYQYINLGEWGNINLGAGYTHLAMRIAAGGTGGSLIKSGSSVASAVVNVADFPDPMSILFSGIYETD